MTPRRSIARTISCSTGAQTGTSASVGASHRCIGAGLGKEIFSSGLQATLDGLPDLGVLEDQVRRYPSVGLGYGYVCMPAELTPTR